MHMSLPSGHSLLGHFEFDVIYSRDENDQAVVKFQSTDEIGGVDPVTFDNFGSFTMPGITWSSSEATSVADHLQTNWPAWFGSGSFTVP